VKGRLKVVGIGLACFACCLPLILTIAGITTGTSGAVGFWLGRNEALVVAGIGLAYLLTVIIRHLQASRSDEERFPQPTRKAPTS